MARIPVLQFSTSSRNCNYSPTLSKFKLFGNINEYLEDFHIDNEDSMKTQLFFDDPQRR